MKEKLYTIPVNEAFQSECECPLCFMYKQLEMNAVEYTMGPSYMEEDIREATSRLGFCGRHLEQMYQNQNRLGLALIIKTHMDHVTAEIDKLSRRERKVVSASFFKKKEDESAVIDFISKLEETCFVCDKIKNTFNRYIATIFFLYHSEEEFRSRLKASKGFCTAHYKILSLSASQYLKAEELSDFLSVLNSLYLEHMKRVSDDLEWFIQKFDYRYQNDPWKNAKDALPRAMLKTNSIVSGPGVV